MTSIAIMILDGSATCPHTPLENDCEREEDGGGIEERGE